MTVSRIDPEFNTVTRRADRQHRCPAGQDRLRLGGDASGLRRRPASSRGSNPRDRATSSRRVDPNAGPIAIAVGSDAIWVADSHATTVTRSRPDRADDARSASVTARARSLSGQGRVWVADSLDDAVVRIDPSTRPSTNKIHVGASPSGLAFGDGLGLGRERARRHRFPDRCGERQGPDDHVGGSPQALTYANGRVWVTVQPVLHQLRARLRRARPRISRRRRRFHGSRRSPTCRSHGSLLYATCAKLLNYPDRPRSPGARLEPEVAESLPERSADGRTYTFTIRKGFRFSPPSNEPVTAETFKYTIERTLNPRMKSPAAANGYLATIVGAQAYMRERRDTSPGSSPTGDRLTVRLTVPRRTSSRSSRCRSSAPCRSGRPWIPKVSELCPRRGRTTSPPSRPGKAS